MTRINLLPASYQAAQAARHRQRRYAAWGVLLLAAGIAWWQAATLQARQVAHLADQEEHRLQAERSQTLVLTDMDNRRRAGQAMLTLKADLEAPIHTTAIVAALSRALPAGVALTRLSVEMTPVREAAAAPSASSGVPRRTTTALKEPERKPIRLEVEGLAKTEQDMTRCISALSEHRLFSNVKLAKSRQVPDGGTPRFGFTITADIPVNRTYIMKKEASAHAT